MVVAGLLAALGTTPVVRAGEVVETEVVETEVVEIDGVVYVRNPAVPPEGVVTMELRERWRVGAEREDLLLGVVTEAASDDDGRVYLVDRQLSEIHVLEPDGTYLRSIGSQGEAPGEVSQLGGMVLMPDGLIGMIQRFPGRIVMLDSNGVPAGSLVPRDLEAKNGGFSSLSSAACRAGRLVLGGARMLRTGGRFQRREFVRFYETDGTPLAAIFESETEPDFANVEWVEKDNYSIARGGLWALDPQGRVYAASFRDRYAVEVHDAAGGLERIIEREYSPYKRTPDEKAEVGRGMPFVVNGRRAEVEIHAEDYAPCISRLFIGPDGWLWVATAHSYRNQPEGVFATIDLFDPEGQFRRQVALRCRGNPRQDRLLMLDSQQFLLIRNFEDAARSMRAGSGGDDEGDEEEPAEQDVPLEIILYDAPTLR